MNTDHTAGTVILQPAPSAAELLALLEAAYQNAHPTDWEMRVRNALLNVLGHSDPADVSPDDKDRVYWLVKQTGLGDPDGWIVGHRARLEAAAKEDAGPIDEALTCDGLVFPTQFDRIRYIITFVGDRAQWLKNNPGRWQRIEDVLREIASRQAPAESEVGLSAEPAGPSDQTPPGTQHDDHKDHAPMVGTLAEDRSPPDDSTLVPPLAPAIGEDGTTKSEAVPVNPTMSGATTPAAQSATRAQLDAKGVSSASVTLGSPGNIGDIAANRKSVECDSVALDSSPATTPAALPPRVAFGTTLAGVLSRALAPPPPTEPFLCFRREARPARVVGLCLPLHAGLDVVFSKRLAAS